jgi:hypothetical protein
MDLLMTTRKPQRRELNDKFYSSTNRHMMQEHLRHGNFRKGFHKINSNHGLNSYRSYNCRII